MQRKSVPHLSPVPIWERIAKAMAEFTPSQRQMAEYVLVHSFQAATMSIDELAEAAGVSVATANRFAGALGFSGFPAFRAEWVRGFENALAPVEQGHDELTHKASCAEVMAASLSDTLANLETIRQSLPANACEQAVAAILGARRVLVVGFGDSGYLAGMLAHGLELYRPQVQSLADVGGVAHGVRTLSRLQAQDVVVPIAFPRHLKDTIVIARKAKECGARIVALTDSPISPLAPFGEPTLYVPAAGRFAVTSNSTIHAVIEALCAAVAHHAKNSVESSVAMTEAVLPWLYEEGNSA